MAVLEPGRKSIAQGESKVATSETVNGRPELPVGWAVEPLEVPQAVSMNKSPVCNNRCVIHTAPLKGRNLMATQAHTYGP
jgi:hypothetical protein